jgi:hypothetical protein
MIQYEHIVPIALDGETRSENLTLHCTTHNQLAAVGVFGVETMGKYFHIDRDHIF